MLITPRPPLLDFEPKLPQQKIFNHLLKHKLAMLFVAMGAGKTAACLWVIDWLLKDIDSIGVLIVAPMRVANLTWPMEVEQWRQFNWLKVANLRTKAGQKAFIEGKAHIYTINYESLPKLVGLIEDKIGTNRAATAADLPFDTVLFDESTMAKNPKAKRVQEFRAMVPRVQRYWAMTGTPAPNSLLDLFAQVRLVDNGARLGHSFNRFKKQFFAATDWNGYNWQPIEGAQQFVEQKISDITLTISAADTGYQAETHFEDVEVGLTSELRKQYRELEKELVLELDDVKINAANAAALIGKLLQFTSGATYYQKLLYDIHGEPLEILAREVHHLHNAKLDALQAIVTEHKGKAILVGVSFQHEQERIRKRFPQAVFMEDFKTLDSQKQLIQDWNAGKVPMLVTHPKSAGHGLNLQYGCHILVWTTLTHNREHYEQMIGRLARQGQREVVLIYRLMIAKTVDEAVATSLQSKQDTEFRLLAALKMLEAFRGQTLAGADVLD